MFGSRAPQFDHFFRQLSEFAVQEGENGQLVGKLGEPAGSFSSKRLQALITGRFDQNP